MKNELQLICENRLKQVLIKDKDNNPQKIIEILKSEILYILKNYMDITSENLNLNIYIESNGYYKVELNAEVKRIKTASYFLE